MKLSELMRRHNAKYERMSEADRVRATPKWAAEVAKYARKYGPIATIHPDLIATKYKDQDIDV